MFLNGEDSIYLPASPWSEHGPDPGWSDNSLVRIVFWQHEEKLLYVSLAECPVSADGDLDQFQVLVKLEAVPVEGLHVGGEDGLAGRRECEVLRDCKALRLQPLSLLEPLKVVLFVRGMLIDYEQVFNTIACYTVHFSAYIVRLLQQSLALKIMGVIEKKSIKKNISISDERDERIEILEWMVGFGFK